MAERLFIGGRLHGHIIDTRGSASHRSIALRPEWNLDAVIETVEYVHHQVKIIMILPGRTDRMIIPVMLESSLDRFMRDAQLLERPGREAQVLRWVQDTVVDAWRRGVWEPDPAWSEVNQPDAGIFPAPATWHGWHDPFCLGKSDPAVWRRMAIEVVGELQVDRWAEQAKRQEILNQIGWRGSGDGYLYAGLIRMQQILEENRHYRT